MFFNVSIVILHSVSYSFARPIIGLYTAYFQAEIKQNVTNKMFCDRQSVNQTSQSVRCLNLIN